MEEKQDPADDAGQAQGKAGQGVDQLEDDQSPSEVALPRVGRQLERADHDVKQVQMPHLLLVR
jgi:hypothetical protein